MAINFYWLLPFAHKIVIENLSSPSASSEVYESLDLLSWTSSHNSLLNLVRLQGDIFWFDGWGGDRLD